MKKTLQQALPIVAAALGDKLGVQVVVAGTEAATNGTVIILPNCDTVVDESVVYGYIAHEAAHVRFTDFEVIRNAGNPLEHRMTNVLEDIRIEQEIAKIYPGTTRMLNSTLQSLVDQGAMEPSDDNPAAVIVTHALLRLRSTVLNQDMLTETAARQENILRKTFSKEVVTKLNGLLSLAVDAKSTEACKNLARRILSMLKEEEKKEKEKAAAKAEEGGEEQKSAGQNSAGSEGGDQQGPGEHDPGQDQDGSEQDSSGDHGQDGHESPDPGQDSTGQDNTGGAGADDTDPQGADALSAALNSGDGDMPEDVFTAIKNVIEQGAKAAVATEQMPEEIYRLCPGQYAELIHRVESESASIVAALHGIVQSARQDRPYDRRSGRRINERKLYRLRIGDSRVFVRHTERQAPNTALFLLLDLSGSMSGTQEIAKEAALSLALALDRINGVSTALTVFPYETGRAAGIARVHSLMHFGDDPRMASLGLAKHVASGGTPMSEALLFAGSRLLARQEKRKAVMVITDGQPNDSVTAKHTIDMMIRAGMETYGVGIATMSVVDLFPQHIVINGIAELKTAIFDMARRILITHAA